MLEFALAIGFAYLGYRRPHLVLSPGRKRNPRLLRVIGSVYLCLLWLAVIGFFVTLYTDPPVR
jgi:hypothetical protein